MEGRRKKKRKKDRMEEEREKRRNKEKDLLSYTLKSQAKYVQEYSGKSRDALLKKLRYR